MDAAGCAEFQRLLAARAIRAHFQPMVDLHTGETVGFEAFARGPAGTPWEDPVVMLDAAYTLGVVAELDWVCRAAAFTAALEAGLPPSMSLFVNTEPVAQRAACPPDLQTVIRAAESRLRVIMEVTERATTADPAGLLAGIAHARDVGWGVALGDVGTHTQSLAMLPFIRPDAIKLDIRLLQGRTAPEAARIVNTVLTHAERAGVSVIAEGIKTVEQAELAAALSATVGQGFLYGPAGPLPETSTAPRRAVPLQYLADDTIATPYQVIAAHRPLAEGPKQLLLPISRFLENKLLDSEEPNVLLASVQHARHLTPATLRRFSRIARRAAFTGVVGVGVPPRPAAGVHGAALDPYDPLRDEWALIAVGPYFAAALVAKDTGNVAPDPQRRFSYALTHDRELVVPAAQALLNAFVPTGALTNAARAAVR